MKTQAPAIAIAAAMLAFAWQWLTVRYTYGGNWTALFCTGAEYRAPPDALASEHIYRFANSNGYDGQFYHYMAHDPFLNRGFFAAFDSPHFRYRRILVSLAAWCLAAGHDRFVDIAFFAVILGCVFLAALWISCIASGMGAHPAWGSAVLLIPAVVVSIDRMTVDVALVALTAGIILYTHRSRWGIVFVLCALAGLVRESGLLLPAGIFAWATVTRRFQLAGLMAISTLPTFAWYVWLAQRTPSFTGDVLSPVPFLGLFRRVVYPYPYSFGAPVNLLATVLDYCALAGILVAVLYTAVRVRDLSRRPDGFIAFSFVALVAGVSAPEVWMEAYAFARGYSPLILLVGLDALRTRSSLVGRMFGALPLALTAPRVFLQLGPQVIQVVRGVTGF